MHLERNTQRLRRAAVRAVAVACLLLVGAAAAFGQDAAATEDQEFTVTDLLKLPGKVVGRGGGNAAPRGLLKLRSYRVEEVALPRIATVEVRGQRRSVTKAYRVTITGGPFAVRALPPVVWIGDEAIGFGVESEDLTEITAVTYDESLLEDGATLYLSYGDKGNKEGRTAVPERLKLDAKGVNQ